MTTYRLRQTYENPHTGLRTLEVPRDCEDVVSRWLGHPVEQIARDARRNRRGRLTIKAGGGLDIVDNSLFGSNGDGSRYRAFQNDTDHRINY